MAKDRVATNEGGEEPEVTTGVRRRFRLPVNMQRKTSTWPADYACPICSKSFDGAFAVLNGGALMGEGKKGYPSMDARLVGFLDMTWHGAHHHADPKDNDVYTGLFIADQCADGQFDLYFCSTACLRKFLNSCVDRLERRVAKDRKRMKEDLAKMARKRVKKGKKRRTAGRRRAAS